MSSTKAITIWIALICGVLVYGYSLYLNNMEHVGEYYIFAGTLAGVYNGLKTYQNVNDKRNGNGGSTAGDIVKSKLSIDSFKEIGK